MIMSRSYMDKSSTESPSEIIRTNDMPIFPIIYLILSTMMAEDRSQEVVLINSPEVSISDLHLSEVSDDPQASPNIGTYPYNCIGLLKFSNPSNGHTLNGTAFLIAADLAVTCAHNLYSRTENAYYTQVEFHPSSTQKDGPAHKAKLHRVPPEFRKGTHEGEVQLHDIGMVKLARPVIRERYLQIKYNFKMEGSEICLFGFPKPLREKRLFGRQGRLLRLRDTIGEHSIGTQPGQDGSPLLIRQKGVWQLVGVHLNCSPKGNEALMICKDTMTTLCKWEREMMHSQIEFSQYAEIEQPRKEEFVFDFAINEYDKEISRNLQPTLDLSWSVPAVNANKINISQHRITRVKNGLLDDIHKQCVSNQALPSKGVYRVKFRVISYGASDSPDSVYFGLTTQKCKEKPASNGRDRQSLAFCSIAGSFKEKGKGRGSILMEGRQMAYSQDLFVQEGGELHLEINMNEHCLLWSNGRREVSHRLSKCFRSQPVYLFVALATHDTRLSWCAQEQTVWQ